MSNQPREWVIKAQTAAAQNKKVLFVEGKTDVKVYTEWLKKLLGPTWANEVFLEESKDRPNLVSGLRWLRDNNDPAQAVIFGLADRDEWEADDLAALAGELPTLLVNPQRHSLESYFCDPDEIELILGERDAVTGKDEFAPRMAGLRDQMEDARKDYVPNWALAHVLQRANERIRDDERYPTYFHNTCPLPPDGDILAKLEAWAGVLEPNSLFAAFDTLRTGSLLRPVSEQFRSCIESKVFLGKVVLEGPHGLTSIQPKSKEDWMIELARWSPAMPSDLQAILAPVLT